MELSKFLTRCRNPKVITNKQGKQICVSCCKCPDCLNSRNSRYTKKIIDESKLHKFTYFITLTYDYVNLPTMLLKEVPTTHGKNIHCIDVTNRYVNPKVKKSRRKLPTYNETIHTISTDFSDPLFKLFYKKAHERGSNIHKRKSFRFLPYLSKIDLQRFIKRLRFKISDIFDEKIRYFAMGEYTPQHFLPHYHLILFFDSEELARELKRIVNTCWQYGIIDCEPAKSSEGCASYVASYTNSFVALPSFLNGSKIKPFSIHSQGLGSFYDDEIRDFVYLSRRYNFEPVDIEIDNKTFQFSFTNEVSDRFFPRCYRHDEQTSYNLFQLYTCYKKLSSEYKVYRASELTRYVLVVSSNYYNKSLLLSLDIDNDIIDLSILSAKIQTYEDLDELDTSIYNRIYSAISNSKLFCYNLQSPSLSNPLYKSFRERANYFIQIIQDFYNQREQFNLSQQLTLQQIYSDTFVTDDYDIFYPIKETFISETNDENYKIIYDRNQAVKIYNFEKDILYETKIKHKKLNDLNKIFVDLY